MANLFMDSVPLTRLLTITFNSFTVQKSIYPCLKNIQQGSLNCINGKGILQIHNPLGEKVPSQLSPKSAPPHFEAMPPCSSFTRQWKQLQSVNNRTLESKA